MPPVTARTRVHRALAGLRARLGGLRALFVLPGVHATALGLTLLTAGAPGLAPPTRAPAAVPPAASRLAPARRPARPVIAVEPTPPPPAPAPPPARDARPARAPAPPAPIPSPQVFVFGNETVEGDTVGPEGERIVIVPPIQHPSLIELRRHFVAEVVKSMEEL